MPPRWLGTTILLLCLGGSSPDAVAQTVASIEESAPAIHSGAKAEPIEALEARVSAVRSMKRGNETEAIQQLRKATKADPNCVSAWIDLANIGLRSDPQHFLEGLSGLSRAIASSWEVQRRLVAILLPALLTALTLAALLLLAGIGLRHLPRTRHVLLEAFRPHLGRWRAGSVATLLCLAPLAIQWGSAAAATSYAGLVRHNLDRRELRLGIVALLWFLLLPAVWNLSTRYVVPIDPHGVSYLIERTQRETPDPSLEQALQEASASCDDASLAFAQGMMYRRYGRLDEARIAFEQVTDREGPISGLAWVNLGNLRLWQGDPTTAARTYERALDQPVARLEARYNLAIALSQLHRFEEADQQLDHASAIDFDQVRSAVRAGSLATDVSVMDGMLSPSELWKIGTSPRMDRASLPPLLRWTLPAGRLDLLWIGLLGGLAAGLVLGSLVRKRLRVYQCQHCGTPVCRKCVVRTAGHAYCSNCATSIGSMSRPAYNRALLLRLLNREPEVLSRRSWILIRALPGVGPTLCGRPVWGLSLSFLFLFGLLLATRLAWAAPPSVALGGLETLLQWFGATIATCGWAISYSVARRTRIQSGVRRYFEKDVYRSAA